MTAQPEERIVTLQHGDGSPAAVVVVRPGSDERELEIARVEPVGRPATEAELGTLLRAALNRELVGQITSAEAFPSATDERLCAILTAAGGTRTGQFMRRTAFREDGRISFRPLALSQLHAYLDDHARRRAQQIAALIHHDVERIRRHILDEFLSTFPHGALSHEAAVHALVDQPTQCIVGTMWTSWHDEGGIATAFIEEFAIDAAVRGRGHGERALRAIGNASYPWPAATLSLFVQPENAPAYRLYQKLGFAAGRYEYVLYPDPVSS